MGRFKNSLGGDKPLPGQNLSSKLEKYLDMTAQSIKSKDKFLLVNEAYSFEEAKELLMCLVAGTVRFHAINSMHLWETKGSKNEQSEKRKKELDKIRKDILNMLNDIDDENLSFEIKAEVKVTAKKA